MARREEREPPGDDEDLTEYSEIEPTSDGVEEVQPSHEQADTA